MALQVVCNGDMYRTGVSVMIPRLVGDLEVPVKTWADGWGRWHAEFPTSGNPRRDVHIARAAIGFEVACREGASAANYLSVTRDMRYVTVPYDGSTHYVEKAD